MSVWKTLSAIDCSQHTEKKGQLTYLSWTWAWSTLMENYPSSEFEMLPAEVHPDSCVTVHCSVTVDGVTRRMWLPVMDNRNNAIQNPDARKISDAKMRCLVKCIALHGLGMYIYAGEDLPEAVKDANEADAKAEADALFKRALEAIKTAPDGATLKSHWDAAKSLASTPIEAQQVHDAKEARKKELGL